ncbi:Bromodomain-containing protein [Hesseltinella vesiculosa]|uniref:Bromodomain-containing protein n=1 Tax=Hesseltinella vesiculosa TaxID=101127 RepID=A0A1X2GJ67_9FUNG|nr:Bromodomain-containing protein [Hesseltinella vesiculosa]
MEERPKRRISTSINYRDSKRPREPKVTVLEPTRDKISDGDVEKCNRLLKDILDLRDEEDPTYYISMHFRELPPKADFPDYYDTIRRPIALDAIANKIKTKTYSSFQDMKEDLKLMVTNAKRYNVEETQVYQDAVTIRKFVKSWELKQIKPKTLITFTKAQPTMIRISTTDLAAKKTHAKDLMKAIEDNDSDTALKLINQDKVDVNQLVKVKLFQSSFTWGPLHAACYYGHHRICQALLDHGANVELNDTWYSGTPLAWAAFGGNDQIARMLIQKYHADKNARNVHDQVPFDLVSEPDDPRWRGVFTAAVKTPTPAVPAAAPAPATSAVPAAPVTSTKVAATIVPTSTAPKTPWLGKRRGRPPKSETESRRQAEKPTEPIDLNRFNPCAYIKSVMTAVRKRRDNGGRLYAELFEELPDRKLYADYYMAIADPVSLDSVEDKLIDCKYPTIKDWFKDMMKMFENAIEYNEPGSRVFRDAKLLYRLMPRLQEQYLFQQGVPESQFDDVSKMDLASKPFDPTGLLGKRARYMEHLKKVERQLSANAPIDVMPPLQSSTPASMMAMPPIAATPSTVPPFYSQPLASTNYYSSVATPSNGPLADMAHTLATQAAAAATASATMPTTALSVHSQQTPNRYPLPGGARFMPPLDASNRFSVHQARPPPYPLSSTTPPVDNRFSGLHATTEPPSRYPVASSGPAPNRFPPSQPSLQSAQQPQFYGAYPTGSPPQHGMSASPRYPAQTTSPVQPGYPQTMPSQPISPDLAELLSRPPEKTRYLSHITVANDAVPLYHLDGLHVAHNVVIPNRVETLRLNIQLTDVLAFVKNDRVHLQVMLNNAPQSPSPSSFSALPNTWALTLASGLNECQIIVNINAAEPSSPAADYRTQVYQLFINHIS